MDIAKKHDVHCVRCGVRTGLFTREKLSKGECLCLKCQHKLPTLFYESFKLLSIEQYNKMLTYITEEIPILSEAFKDYHSYLNLHLDPVNGILMYKSQNAPDLYLKAENIISFRLKYLPDKKKKGGKVEINLECSHPPFFIDTTINDAESDWTEVSDFMSHYEFMHERLVTHKFQLENIIL